MTNLLLTTKELINKYQLNAKKSLGQNFILDKNFTDKIAKSANILRSGNSSDINLNNNDLSNFEVLEVGAGPGGLTRSILDAGVKKLIVIEKDQRCILALKELQDFYGPRLEIIEDDALQINELDLFNPQQKFKIIANLPYNIGTPLIFKWLKILPRIESMTLMLQKEVVQRICAKVGDNHYGRLSAMLNLLCDCKMLFEVNKMVFSPPPKVTSAVVQILPNQYKMADFYEVNFLKNYEFIVAQSFNQRRKMLKSALKSCFNLINFNSAQIDNFFAELKIDNQKRAEEISITEFCQITSAYMNLVKS